MKAILIAGVESFLAKELPIVSDLGTGCLSFYSYLRKKVRLFEKKIFYYSGRDILRFKSKRLLSKIEKIILMSPSEPLVIYYNGHGLGGEWSIFSENGIGKLCLNHKRLLKVLKKQQGPLIMIADCCYAMSIKEQLKKLKCEWLLLGAAPKNRIGYDDVSEKHTITYGVISQIIRSWLKHKPANPKYFDGERKVRNVKKKIVDRSKYVLSYNSKKKEFKKFYYSYSFKKIKMVLRQGDDLDSLLYSKVKEKNQKKKKKRIKKKK
jgi:hypothetical protein